MRYVALLRGINVGGARKVKMTELRAAFEAAGMHSVTTYINSGNVVFSTSTRDSARLRTELEAAVRRLTGFGVDVHVRSARQFRAVVEAIPGSWRNDKEAKCDVVFLDPGLDARTVLEELGPRPGIEEALCVPGAIVWHVSRENATRSRLMRIVGTPLYAQVTIRNCNTARHLLDLVEGG